MSDPKTVSVVISNELRSDPRVGVNGDIRKLPRGKRITIPAPFLEALDRAGVPYTLQPNSPGGGEAGSAEGSALPADLNATVKELKAIADAEGVVLEGDDNKADIQRKIADAREKKAAAPDAAQEGDGQGAGSGGADLGG